MYSWLMSRMVRKQIYIEADQELQLKAESERLGVSEAELVRRGLMLVARGASEAKGRPARDASRAARAWAEARLLMERLAVEPSGEAGERWTRDDLYTDRLDRLAH